jgi:MraZ protein
VPNRDSFEIRVDDKNRITIPLKLREGLGSPVIMSRGSGVCLFLMREDVWVKNFEEKFEKAQLNDKSMIALERYYRSGLTEAAPDTQGRLVLNSTLREHAKIEKETDIVLTFMNKRIEIWSKSVLDAANALMTGDTLLDSMAATGVGSDG